MKKNLSILGLAMIPALAVAGGTAIKSTTTVTAANCSLLQDDLKIQLSNGVVGGYECDDTTTNTIMLSTCHTSGRVSTRTVNTVVNPTQCTKTPSDTAACLATTSSASGAVVGMASTAGGSMAFKFPGSVCDTSGTNAAAVLP